MNSEKRLIYQAAQCDACGACVEACRQHWHGARADCSPDLIGSRLAVRKQANGSHIHLCRHCAEPPCVSACPIGALRPGEMGTVVLEPEECGGCAACLTACPFNTIFWNEEKAVAYKCNFGDRLSPPCAEACPRGALTWVLPSEEARRRQHLQAERRSAPAQTRRTP